MPTIHPLAVVEPGAQLAAGVSVGPFCYVAAGACIGAGSVLLAHVSVLGAGTRIGRNNRVFPGAVLGAPPQDRSYRGEPAILEVGDDNEIREQVTLHGGTQKGGGVTRVGSRGLFMVGAHVAHDCTVGSDVILTNLATLGGHVVVEDHVVCGGHVAVQPFVRLGRGCFLAGGAKVEHDVPPFVIAAGDRARVRALNRVGLERMGVPEASCASLERAFRVIWGKGTTRSEGLRTVERGDPYVDELTTWLEARRG